MSRRLCVCTFHGCLRHGTPESTRHTRPDGKEGYGWAVNSAPCRENDSQHSADIIEDGQAPICYGPGRVQAPAARFTPYFFVFAVNESKSCYDIAHTHGVRTDASYTSDLLSVSYASRLNTHTSSTRLRLRRWPRARPRSQRQPGPNQSACVALPRPPPGSGGPSHRASRSSR